MQSPRLFLAYDGSINADWVARYAIGMSRNTPGRQLTLLHILDGSMAKDIVAAKVSQLLAESRRVEVELTIIYQQVRKNVFATLLETIPWGDACYCICGARATSRGKGFLAGTISQELLRSKKFNTLALRVVNPGLLGCPAHVMFPLSGHPRKFAAARPFFSMLAPGIKKLVLLRIMLFNPLVFPYISLFRAQKSLQRGVAYMQAVIEEIEQYPERGTAIIDDHVLISDDWGKEILIQACKVQVGLILLGASDRLLQSRFYYGNTIEQILRRTPCDVGIYRKI
ncbi:MAG: universal stress protein [Desulfobulbus sp.]|nr:universal stress protein [Desulfobulbus sp.]